MGAMLCTVVPKAMPAPVTCWPTNTPGVAPEPMRVAAVLLLVVCMTSDWAVGAVGRVMEVRAVTPAVVGLLIVKVVGLVIEAIVEPTGMPVPATVAPIMRLFVPVVSVMTLLPLVFVTAAPVAMAGVPVIGVKSSVEAAVGASRVRLRA